MFLDYIFQLFAWIFFNNVQLILNPMFKFYLLLFAKILLRGRFLIPFYSKALSFKHFFLLKNLINSAGSAIAKCGRQKKPKKSDFVQNFLVSLKTHYDKRKHQWHAFGAKLWWTNTKVPCYPFRNDGITSISSQKNPSLVWVCLSRYRERRNVHKRCKIYKQFRKRPISHTFPTPSFDGENSSRDLVSEMQMRQQIQRY